MNAFRSRFVEVTVREVLLLLISAVGAWLFFNHEFFYFRPNWQPDQSPLASYVLFTTITYMFIHAVFVIASLRAPRVRAGLELCPECGQPLDDGTPKGIESHHRVALTPRPTEKEILAAIALRKAIDGARIAPQTGRTPPATFVARIPSNVMNAPPGSDPLQIPPGVSVTPRLLKQPQKPKGPA